MIMPDLESLVHHRIYRLGPFVLIGHWHGPCGCSNPECCTTGWWLYDRTAYLLDESDGVRLMVDRNGCIVRPPPANETGFVEPTEWTIDDLMPLMNESPLHTSPDWLVDGGVYDLNGTEVLAVFKTCRCG